MHNRLRLMMGATALLYFGPLLAGLVGYGWWIVPVFVVIFPGWTLFLRPSIWPQTVADRTRPHLLVTLLAQSLMQVLLVVVCFGIGRGVVAGLPPRALMPVGVSFLAIALCRLIRNPKKAKAMGRVLDTAPAPDTAPAHALR